MRKRPPSAEPSDLPTLKTSAPAAVPAGAWFNYIARKWMVLGPDGAVPVDPQPAAPNFLLPDGRPVAITVDTGRQISAVPPAVKVMV